MQPQSSRLSEAAAQVKAGEGTSQQGDAFRQAFHPDDTSASCSAPAASAVTAWGASTDSGLLSSLTAASAASEAAGLQQVPQQMVGEQVGQQPQYGQQQRYASPTPANAPTASSSSQPSTTSSR